MYKAATWRRQCGTTAGYLMHLRVDEKPCPPCIGARVDFTEQAGRELTGTKRQQAKRRAFTRLGEMFPDALEAMYQEELGVAIASQQKLAAL